MLNIRQEVIVQESRNVNARGEGRAVKVGVGVTWVEVKVDKRFWWVNPVSDCQGAPRESIESGRATDEVVKTEINCSRQRRHTEALVRTRGCSEDIDRQSNRSVNINRCLFHQIKEQYTLSSCGDVSHQEATVMYQDRSGTRSQMKIHQVKSLNSTSGAVANRIQRKLIYKENEIVAIAGKATKKDVARQIGVNNKDQRILDAKNRSSEYRRQRKLWIYVKEDRVDCQKTSRITGRCHNVVSLISIKIPSGCINNIRSIRSRKTFCTPTEVSVDVSHHHVIRQSTHSSSSTKSSFGRYQDKEQSCSIKTGYRKMKGGKHRPTGHQNLVDWSHSLGVNVVSQRRLSSGRSSKGFHRALLDISQHHSMKSSSSSTIQEIEEVIRHLSSKAQKRQDVNNMFRGLDCHRSDKDLGSIRGFNQG
ncbi:unnamed protein product [Caenorhabditis brenneri]